MEGADKHGNNHLTAVDGRYKCTIHANFQLHRVMSKCNMSLDTVFNYFRLCVSTLSEHAGIRSSVRFKVPTLKSLPEVEHVGYARVSCKRSRLRVIVPVQVLQVVGGQDVDVAAAADSSVIDDALGVAALEQTLQGLQPFARLFGD